MTDEALITLGKSLRAEYQAWLVRFVPSWPDEFRLAVNDWETLNQVNAECVRLLRYIQDCLELDAWLSSGFFPTPDDDSGFDPIIASDFPRAPESERLVTSVTADRDATSRQTIPLPADSADTATIASTDSPVLAATTGLDFGLSGGGLRDLARRLQIMPHSDTGGGDDDRSLTEPHPFRTEMAGPESAGSAESDWPVLTETGLQVGTRLRVPRLVSAITELPEAGLEEHAMLAFSVQESGVVTQPTGTGSAVIPVPEDAEGLTAADLRRLGQELSVDNTNFPAIASVAASAPVVDWRKLLSMLPLRRERFIAPPAIPGSAGVPAGMTDLRREAFIALPAMTGSTSVPTSMTVGDDDFHRPLPQVLQHKITTDIPAVPNSAAVVPPDLHDLLEALSREIWREYQRFYGSE